MLQVLGALSLTGLLSAFFNWVLRRWTLKARRAPVHALSLLSCGVLAMLWSATKSTSVSSPQFVDGIVDFAPAQVFWLVLSLWGKERSPASSPRVI